MREALTNFGCEPEAVATLRGRNVAAFVELHIEQGPVLEVGEAADRRRHCDQWRNALSRDGARPCRPRRRNADEPAQDALAAAAEMMLMIEARARSEEDLVATVGRFEVGPGASTSSREKRVSRLIARAA